MLVTATFVTSVPVRIITPVQTKRTTTKDIASIVNPVSRKLASSRPAALAMIVDTIKKAGRTTV